MQSKIFRAKSLKIVLYQHIIKVYRCAGHLVKKSNKKKKLCIKKFSRCAASNFKSLKSYKKKADIFLEATAQLVTEKDRKISPVFQLVTEKDRTIRLLPQLVTEKDRTILISLKRKLLMMNYDKKTEFVSQLIIAPQKSYDSYHVISKSCNLKLIF